MSNIQINYLIKALTKPYCGASFLKIKEFTVFRSEVVSDFKKKYENLEYGKIINVSKILLL